MANAGVIAGSVVAVPTAAVFLAFIWVFASSCYSHILVHQMRVLGAPIRLALRIRSRRRASKTRPSKLVVAHSGNIKAQHVELGRLPRQGKVAQPAALQRLLGVDDIFLEIARWLHAGDILSLSTLSRSTRQTVKRYEGTLQKQNLCSGQPYEPCWSCGAATCEVSTRENRSNVVVRGSG